MSSLWQEVLFSLQLPALVQISELIEKGGPVLLLISSAALMMLLLISERFLYLGLNSKRDLRHIASEWQQREVHDGWSAYRIRDAYLANFRLKAYAHHNLVKLLIVICPLLGLLGTVTGMISVFEVLAFSGTEFGGSSNVRSMAAGISRATIPTLAGMFVAITGLLLLVQIDRLAQKRQHSLSAFLDMK